MAKIEIDKTELVWPGKYNDDGVLEEVPRVGLPFQVIETINESRATREATKKGQQQTLFDIWEGKEGDTFEEGWKNKLVWGDNLLVASSLLANLAGKIDLIYIDPPFATGADFSFKTDIGDLGFEVAKEQSILEEKAYRDTWGKGRDSFIEMLYRRLQVFKDLLSNTGNFLLHLDWHVGSYVKPILDELFGEHNFRNEIIWHYRTGNLAKKQFQRKHENIYFYSNSEKAYFKPLEFKEYYADIYGPGFKPSFKGRQQARDAKGYYRIAPVDDVWDISAVFTLSDEHLPFDTQKPEALLYRIVESTCPPGGLVADLFCGSGTTLAIAEKTGRRWIGCDLGRYAIHTTRKRLLGVENCRPFEVLNLGKYERKYWIGVTFGDKKKDDQQLALYQYVAFILKLYGAKPLSGMQHLHGKKGRGMVHVGAVDAPVTIDEVNACIEECLAVNQSELHVLGWEWEMGMTPYIVQEAKRRGLKLLLLTIPREVMEQQAVDMGDVQFFEVAHVEIGIKKTKGRKVTVSLKDFAFPYSDLIPDDVRKKISKWSDYVDYWAVDWNFQNDTFMNGWVTYRTRKERKLTLTSDSHTYEKTGKYTIMVKVVDIFGNDTSQVFGMEVK